MKNTFMLKGLDCANCAAKIENKVQKIKGVQNATVNFMTGKMIIECEEENKEDIIKEAKKIVKKIEPDTQVVEI